MSYLSDFELWEEPINTMPLIQIKLPDQPIDVTAADAETLYQNALKDKEALTAAGLDWSKVENIPTKAGALRYTQALWMNEYQSRKEAQKEWLEESPNAYELKKELLHHFSFAFRNYPDVTKKVMRIREGSSHADMIQDLIELAVLGESNQEPLIQVGFDITTLQTAKTTSSRMSELLATANSNKDESSTNKLNRDKAYTLLMEDISDIREVGKYVFWRDEDRKEKYVNSYNKS